MTLVSHNSWVLTLTQLQNGDLVSGSNDATIKIWNPIDGSLKRTLRKHTDAVGAKNNCKYK
jgi:WD40 repeat protein